MKILPPEAVAHLMCHPGEREAQAAGRLYHFTPEERERLFHNYEPQSLPKNIPHEILALEEKASLKEDLAFPDFFSGMHRILEETASLRTLPKGILYSSLFDSIQEYRPLRPLSGGIR